MKVTPEAETFIKSNLPEGQFLLVQVASGGCNGFQYKLSAVSDVSNLAKCSESVYTDTRSMLFLKNSILVLEKDLSGETLEIKNPDTTSECGCKKSFSV